MFKYGWKPALLGLLALLLTASRAASAYDMRVVNCSEAELAGYPVVIKLARLPEPYRTDRLRVLNPAGQQLRA